MKVNPWLAGYLVFTALLLGGAGYFFWQGRAAFDEQFSGWDRLKAGIDKLESQPIYPNEANYEELRKRVESFEAKVSGLSETLKRYQKPLNTQLTDSEFTNQILKDKVTGFLKVADEAKLTIDKREAFYLGFEAYQTTIPRPEIVPALNNQLEAIERLLQTLAGKGVSRLISLTRDPLPGEQVTADPNAAVGIVAGQVVQKYPVTLRFVSSHDALQNFLNTVANDKDYFFIVRVLRIDNSSPDGPVLDGTVGAAGEIALPVFKKADGTTATREEMEKKGRGTLPNDEFLAAMRADGWEEQRQDARMIFGEETLETYAVIDLVRFLTPEEAAKTAPPAPPAPAAGASKKGGAKSGKS